MTNYADFLRNLAKGYADGLTPDNVESVQRSFDRGFDETMNYLMPLCENVNPELAGEIQGRLAELKGRCKTVIGEHLKQYATESDKG